jgi:hypothetical protein
LCPRDHLIGSACAHEFAASDAARWCSHCRTRIAVPDNAIHKWYLRWLEWIATSEWFVSKDRTTFADGVAYSVLSNAQVACMRKGLCKQTLTLSKACDIWEGHVHCDIVRQAPGLLLFVLVLVAFTMLNAYCYPRYPEQMLISLLAGFETHKLSWCNFFHALAPIVAWKFSERLQHVPLHILAGVVACRLELILVGFFWTISLTLVPVVLLIILYAVICAVLIAHCMKP